MPTIEKQDFNDVLKNQGKEAVQRALNKPELIVESVTAEKLVRKIECAISEPTA
jgi:hypothetical protein